MSRCLRKAARVDSVPAVDVDLSVLLAAVAQRDRPAFGALYEALCRSTTQVACRMLCRTEDVRAVVHGTFVEVWWMARFHPAADTDVMAWVSGIATRRAMDRDGGDDILRGAEDETNRLVLGALLTERGPALR